MYYIECISLNIRFEINKKGGGKSILAVRLLLLSQFYRSNIYEPFRTGVFKEGHIAPKGPQKNLGGQISNEEAFQVKRTEAY